MPIAAFGLKIQADLKNIIKGELAQNGQWLVANISTDSFWPINSQKVRWRGVDIWIMSVTKSTYPALAMSTLSWVEEPGFMVEGGVGGGNLPVQRHRRSRHRSSFIRLSEPISRGTVTGRRNSRTRLRVSYHPSRTSEHSSVGAAKRRESVRMINFSMS